METNKTIGWNMLDSYQEGQALYGRDDETRSISECIRFNVQTFLYGKSGIGKTSLLQAGVFPELRKNHFFPIIIRLAVSEKKEPLNRLVKRIVQEEAVREDVSIGKVPLTFATIDGSDVGDSPLCEYFSKMVFEDASHTPFVPVLVFDQFEETINNEDHWQRTVDFLCEDLYDLMDDGVILRGPTLNYTNYRLVFSMREDYLYCVEDIIDRYSLAELRLHRFRIKSLDDSHASEVIYRTCGYEGLEPGKEEQIVNTIIKIVKSNSGTRFSEINTALLSLVCSLLSENAGNGYIHYNDLRRINALLNSFYDSICYDIGSKATQYLEDRLLTRDGRRCFLDKSEAIASGKVTEKQLDYLVDKKLIRRIKVNSSSVMYEYIHDLFAKMVFKRKKEDRLLWYQPSFRSISKSLDRRVFVRKFLLTLLSFIVLILATLYFHAYSHHNTIELMDVLGPKGCRLNWVYWFFFYFAAFLIPLLVKRLHDVGHTGWLILLVPLSIILLALPKFFPFFGKLAWIPIAMGCLVLGCLVYQCLRPSTEKKWQPKISAEYEAAFCFAHIDNIEFMKLFLIEFSCWILCCRATDYFYLIFSGYSQWPLRWSRLNLPLLEYLHVKISMISFIALFPVVLGFSPVLRARIKGFGYPAWISYIPYFNVFLLLECLVPDKVLLSTGLIRLKTLEKPQSEDDIFAEIEINPDLLVPSSQNAKNIVHSFLSLFVPLYGVVRSFASRAAFGERLLALLSSFINALFVFVVSIDYWDDFLCVLCFDVLVFLVLGRMVVLFQQNRKEIVAAIKSDPSIGEAGRNIEEILSQRFKSNPKFIASQLKRLERSSLLIKTVDDEGRVGWSLPNKNESENQ